MKKFLFTLLLICGLAWNADAQVYKFMSTEFAYRYDLGDGWTEWSDWEDSHCLIVINLDKEEIDIYSEEPQEFSIYDIGESYEDSKGGTTLELSCVDDEGDRCEIRLRTEKNGNLQLYVDYADVMYVYNLEQK